MLALVNQISPAGWKCHKLFQRKRWVWRELFLTKQSGCIFQCVVLRRYPSWSHQDRLKKKKKQLPGRFVFMEHLDGALRNSKIPLKNSFVQSRWVCNRKVIHQPSVLLESAQSLAPSPLLQKQRKTAVSHNLRFSVMPRSLSSFHCPWEHTKRSFYLKFCCVKFCSKQSWRKTQCKCKASCSYNRVEQTNWPLLFSEHKSYMTAWVRTKFILFLNL